MKSATLERKIDALYGLPLEQFIGERDALAKKLRDDGDKAAAERVKRLAKPSAPAWMANQLYWHARRSFNRLMQAGEELRRIQQGSPGPDALREAVEKRGVAMEAARRELEERVYPDGKTPPPAMLRRIEGTLEAMAALGPEALDPPPGRLSQEIEPPGFGVLFPLLPGRTAKPAASKPKSGKVAKQAAATTRKHAAREKAVAAARARVLRADNELELREAAVGRAESDRSRCAEESRRARDEEKQARQRLELARKRVRKTAFDLERAGKEVQRAKAASRRAKKKRDEAGKAEKAARTRR